MADVSRIEWTDATWNPITGCSVVSPGCTNCYAMKLAGTRLQHHPSRAGLTRQTKAGPVWNGTVRFNEEWLTQPLQWKRPRMVFVCAHGDLFHEDVPDEWIDKVFAVMALAPQHTFQVLTKRAARMRTYLRRHRWHLWAAAGRAIDPLRWQNLPPIMGGDCTPLPNAWLGVSAEDQTRADQRVPELLATPAAVRFVSAEPLLGPIDFRQWQHSYGCGCGWGGDSPIDYCTNCGWRGHAVEREGGGIHCHDCGDALSDYNACPECDGHDGDGMSFGPNSKPPIDWIIVGGESGPGARPMHPDWPRQIRDQCAAAGTAFFFKQWGEWQPRRWKADGGTHAMRVTAPAWGCFQQIQSHPNSIERVEPAPEGWQAFAAVGKKAAGRLLDGVEHNAMPSAFR